MFARLLGVAGSFSGGPKIACGAKHPSPGQGVQLTEGGNPGVGRVFLILVEFSHFFDHFEAHAVQMGKNARHMRFGIFNFPQMTRKAFAACRVILVQGQFDFSCNEIIYGSRTL